ncbi:MAG: endonuclease/exonuclease/phosphatase family protein [Prolixibacteraceae bacterium]|nr:endonuclease/exonuclease/phosphatase family protein [Prolixibacteraceae bacterium]
MKDIIKYSLLLLNIFVALLLAGAYLVSAVSPEQLWYPVFLGLVYPYMLAANIFFVVFWLFVRWKYALLSLFIIFLGLNNHERYIQLMSKPFYGDDDGINLLSFNVHHFYSYLEDDQPEFNVIDFIASHGADIICLQETKLQRTGELNPIKLKDRFPGINHCQLAHQSKWNGPVTFTKYPIVNMGEIRFEDSGNMVMYTDILLDADTIRVYNCHLQSFGIKTDEYSVIDSLGFEGQKIEEMKLIGGKMREAYIKRARQANELAGHINECKYPVIVCGDFNDTPLSYTYRVVGDGLIDAFVESGSGISNTYRGKLPPFRIDYIFYSDYFEGFNYQRHKVEYSDHYPISTVLKVRNDQ